MLSRRRFLIVCVVDVGGRMTELIRRYWVLGIECTLLEIQKLAYFLERQIIARSLPDPLHR